MNRFLALPAMLLTLCVVLSAADKYHYAGDYRLVEVKHPAGLPGVDCKCKIHISFDEMVVRITRTDDDKERADSFPLNGKSVDFRDDQGNLGKARVRYESNSWIVTQELELRKKPQDSPVPIEKKQIYRLSKDGNALTVRYVITFASLPYGDFKIPDDIIETYTRE